MRNESVMSPLRRSAPPGRRVLAHQSLRSFDLKIARFSDWRQKVLIVVMLF